MKKTLLFCAALFAAYTLWAQSPDAFKYQAVARDASGAVLANKNISLRISILEGSSSGTAVFEEVHTSMTNEFGLVNLEIGNGFNLTGSIAGVKWADNDHFLKVEMDPAGGSSYILTGTSQLLSVPYALHAKTVKEGDNWGSQAVVTEASLAGSGTASTPLKIAPQGAVAGQVMKFNGTAWVPGTDLSGTSHWTREGNNIYYNSGWLGLGTSVINHPLSIENANNTCYIHLKDNQGSSGMRIGAYIGELAMINDNIDKNLRFNVNTSSGYKQVLTLTASNQRAGINITEPPYALSVLGGDISIHTSGSGVSNNDGLRVGLGLAGHSWVWNYENGDLYFGTNNLERMRIDKSGNVGIGDNTPDATLDVEGTVVFGSSGVTFSEIREIRGTTGSSGGSTTISYPAGYNMDNIRVLSVEINYSGNSWIGLAGNQQNTNVNERLFYYLGTSIMLYYPNVANFQGRAYRILVMKVG